MHRLTKNDESRRSSSLTQLNMKAAFKAALPLRGDERERWVNKSGSLQRERHNCVKTLKASSTFEQLSQEPRQQSEFCEKTNLICE